MSDFKGYFAFRRIVTDKKNTTLLAAIIVFSILLRIGAVFLLGNEIENQPGTADQLSYHTLAIRVLDGHGFTFDEPWWPATRAGAPTAHWSYLYTFYLAAVYSLFGKSPIVARIVQAALVGFLQPFLVYLLSRRLFGSAVGLISALLTAGYAYFVYYSATLMTESLYIVAILGALNLCASIVRKSNSNRISLSKADYAWAIGLGLCLGAAVLLRQVVLLIIPFLYLWILSVTRKSAGKSLILVKLLICTIVIITLILPFTFNNYQRFEELVLLNTNAGFAFFWANHPVHGTSFQSILLPDRPSYGDLIPEEMSDLNEAELDQELLKRGVQFVLDDPGRYLLLSLSRIGDYFKFLPSKNSSVISNISRVASFGITWPFMLIGLGLAYSKRNRNPNIGLWEAPVSLLALFVLIYSAIHIFSWSLIRYRLPVDAVMLVFAGLAITELIPSVLKRWQGFLSGSAQQKRSAP